MTDVLGAEHGLTSGASKTKGGTILMMMIIIVMIIIIRSLSPGCTQKVFKKTKHTCVCAGVKVGQVPRQKKKEKSEKRKCSRQLQRLWGDSFFAPNATTLHPPRIWEGIFVLVWSWTWKLKGGRTTGNRWGAEKEKKWQHWAHKLNCSPPFFSHNRHLIWINFFLLIWSLPQLKICGFSY